MKVVKKPIEVEAVKYTAGMEDGFVHGIFNHSSGFCSMNISDPLCTNVPYIFENDTYLFISDGDYIITDESGNRSVVESHKFNSLYEVCENGTCSTCNQPHIEEHEQTIDTLIQRLDNVENRLHKLATMAHDAWSSLDV